VEVVVVVVMTVDVVVVVEVEVVVVDVVVEVVVVVVVVAGVVVVVEVVVVVVVVVDVVVQPSKLRVQSGLQVTGLTTAICPRISPEPLSAVWTRSEERRVGKECRDGWGAKHERRK